jgi:chromosome partitioning protein
MTMKVLNIINLKGGVAKTISAINIAHILASVHGKRVLLIDNDKQGNASQFFSLFDYDRPSISDVLTRKNCQIKDAIRTTDYDGLHLLPSNMNLLHANKDILLDSTRQQQTRLEKALEDVNDDYDYVVIDNAPDINMSVINALVTADDVMIPIKIDKFTFDGIAQLVEHIEEIKDFNKKIRIAGCFVTMYQRNGVNTQGADWLHKKLDIPVFKTFIRKTVKVDETTFAGKPLMAYSKNSTAAVDYMALVKEYLAGERK